MEQRFIINDKIRKILIDNGLSPSQFADAIEVQRSTISHIMAYRNRPSRDLIQKIIKWNSQYTFDWFFDDEPVDFESMGYSPHYKVDSYPKKGVANGLDLNKKITPPQIPVQRTENRLTGGYRTNNLGIKAAADKKVVRVMIFYSDQTCESFDSL